MYRSRPTVIGCHRHVTINAGLEKNLGFKKVFRF